MFRHQMCHPQGAFFVTLPNYISTIAAVAKINKVFKTLRLPNMIKRLLLHEVCTATVYTVCVLMLLLCLPGTYSNIYVWENRWNLNPRVFLGLIGVHFSMFLYFIFSCSKRCTVFLLRNQSLRLQAYSLQMKLWVATTGVFCVRECNGQIQFRFIWLWLQGCPRNVASVFS